MYESLYNTTDASCDEKLNDSEYTIMSKYNETTFLLKNPHTYEKSKLNIIPTNRTVIFRQTII